MAATDSILGTRGQYLITDRQPIAFGRQSVLMRVEDGAGKEYCAKLFRHTRKGLAPADADQVLRELRAQQLLSHPHILPVIDYGFVDSTLAPEQHAVRPYLDALRRSQNEPFLILPICRGGDLRQKLSERQFVPLDEAVAIMVQVGMALDFAHQKGFVHGDVKPENVLFREEGPEACLSDFGISRYSEFEEVLTGSGNPIGTTEYLSPEQVFSGERGTTKSDIYSFATLLYELVTGERPVRGRSPLARMLSKVEGNLHPAHDVNPRLDATVWTVLQWGLATDPNDRPDTALDFITAIRSRRLPPDVSAATTKSGLRKWFESLSAANKVAIITATIAALGGIMAAAIKILPDLVGR